MSLKYHELIQKEKTNEGFRSQMQKASQNYNTIKKLAHFSNLSSVNEILVSKFQAEKPLAIDTYFIYGIYINQDKVSMNQITSYFVTVFPKPKKPYIFVYFNDFDSPNNFSNFKNILSFMPIEYFVFLQSIYLVRPSLKMKASRYFTFGTISKYLNNKTINVGSINELSEKLSVRQHEILKFLPLDVRNYFSEEEIQRTSVQVINLSSQRNQRSMTGLFINNRPNPMINTNRPTPSNPPQNLSYRQASQIVAKSPPQPVKLQIDQYPKSQRGIPQFFEILLLYFRQHHDELEQQGIFRKSVSIQDQIDALQKMHKRQYDFLQKVRDPHLVANLIKRFLSKLKSPIIPYKIFDSLMQTQPIGTGFVAQKMKQLFQQNITKYLTLITLLDFMNKKVIPRSYKNKMNIQNISICFSPCIMWAEQRSFNDLIYMNKGVAVVTLMLTNFQQIFGSKKQISKIYRSSFYQQQKKSITKAYNIQNEDQQIEGNMDQIVRETANFGILFLQKKENQYKAQYSDFSDDQGIKNKINIHVISPNQKSTKSQIQKSQLKQVQEEQQRKSDRSGKKSDKNIPEVVQAPTNTSTRRRGMFTSKIQSPRSAKIQEQKREKVSSKKSSQQINSIHSDQ